MNPKTARPITENLSKPADPDTPARICSRCGGTYYTRSPYCNKCYGAYQREATAKKRAAKEAEKAAAAQRVQEAIDLKISEADARFDIEILVPDGRAGKMVPYQPTASQRAFHESPHMARGCFGGRGSGKSLAGLIELLMTALHFPGSQLLVAQLVRSHLEGGTWKLLEKIVPRELIAATCREPLQMRLKNGSTIHGRHLSDPDALGSTFFNAIMIDEVSHLAGDQGIYGELLGRLRTPEGPNKLWVCGYTSGLSWIWRRFVEAPNEDHWSISIDSRENEPHLPKGFLQKLTRNYSPREQAQWLRGEWIEDLGLVFWSFDPALHVIDPERDSRFSGMHAAGIPIHWKKFIGIDPGLSDNLAVVWLAVNEEGEHYVYDTFEIRNVAISEACAEITRRTGSDEIEWIALDPSVAFRRSDETLHKKLDIFQSHLKWPIRAPGRDIADHIAQIRELLLPAASSRGTTERASFARSDSPAEPAETGRPRLFIFAHCTSLIRQLASWRFAPNGKPKDGQDDLVAALRFALAAGPERAEPIVKLPERNPFWTRFQQIIADLDEPESPRGFRGSEGVAWI